MQEFITVLYKIISNFSLVCIIIAIFGIMFYGKDLYQKIHCAGIIDSFAMPLMILGISLTATSFFISLKLVITIFFILITSATSTHCICSVYFKEHQNKLIQNTNNKVINDNNGEF